VTFEGGTSTMTRLLLLLLLLLKFKLTATSFKFGYFPLGFYAATASSFVLLFLPFSVFFCSYYENAVSVASSTANGKRPKRRGEIAI
jgi:hypothetical protein